MECEGGWVEQLKTDLKNMFYIRFCSKDGCSFWLERPFDFTIINP